MPCSSSRCRVRWTICGSMSTVCRIPEIRLAIGMVNVPKPLPSSAMSPRRASMPNLSRMSATSNKVSQWPSSGMPLSLHFMGFHQANCHATDRSGSPLRQRRLSPWLHHAAMAHALYIRLRLIERCLHHCHAVLHVRNGFFIAWRRIDIHHGLTFPQFIPGRLHRLENVVTSTVCAVHHHAPGHHAHALAHVCRPLIHHAHAVRNIRQSRLARTSDERINAGLCRR
jgi:hypothetical protein